MKCRFYFYGSVILLTAGLLIWHTASRPPAELMHDGRPLSAWLNEVGEGPEEQRTRAVAALLAMDPDIWDRLVNMLVVEDSLFRRTITRFGGERAFQRFYGRSADERHGAAVIAFLALGPSARPAIPGLIDLLKDRSSRERAAEALVAIGNDAVPALTTALANTNPEVRRSAAEALDKIHRERGR